MVALTLQFGKGNSPSALEQLAAFPELDSKDSRRIKMTNIKHHTTKTIKPGLAHGFAASRLLLEVRTTPKQRRDAAKAAVAINLPGADA